MDMHFYSLSLLQDSPCVLLRTHRVESIWQLHFHYEICHVVKLIHSILEPLKSDAHVGS
jgi:hypothetical protein